MNIFVSLKSAYLHARAEKSLQFKNCLGNKILVQKLRQCLWYSHPMVECSSEPELLCLGSSFLLILTKGGSRRWLKNVKSFYQLWKCWFLVSVCSRCLMLWAIVESTRRQKSLLCLSLCFCISNKMKIDIFNKINFPQYSTSF